MKVGDKAIPFKRGHDHVSEMDKYLGQVVTISKIFYRLHNKRTYVFIEEDEGEWYFDADALKPVVSRIR